MVPVAIRGKEKYLCGPEVPCDYTPNQLYKCILYGIVC